MCHAAACICVRRIVVADRLADRDRCDVSFCQIQIANKKDQCRSRHDALDLEQVRVLLPPFQIYYINKRRLKEVERRHHVRRESLEIPTLI